jgi:hypothetical protein
MAAPQLPAPSYIHSQKPTTLQSHQICQLLGFLKAPFVLFAPHAAATKSHRLLIANRQAV